MAPWAFPAFPARKEKPVHEDGLVVKATEESPSSIKGSRESISLFLTLFSCT